MAYNAAVRFLWNTPILVILLVLAACAPQATRPAQNTPNTAAASETQTLAQVAHHRMEIGRLQTGAYTTNVLVDLDIPRGVRWTVLEFSGDAYLLRFTHDAVPDVEWLVDPAGVRTSSAPTS
jgi:hypothetical protein